MPAFCQLTTRFFDLRAFLHFFHLHKQKKANCQTPDGVGGTIFSVNFPVSDEAGETK